MQVFFALVVLAAGSARAAPSLAGNVIFAPAPDCLNASQIKELKTAITSIQITLTTAATALRVAAVAGLLALVFLFSYFLQ